MEQTHYFGYIVNGHRSCVSVCHPSILALIHLHSCIPTEIRRASTTTTTPSSSSNDHRGRNRRTRILLHGLVQSQQIWRASDEGQELGQVLVLICKTIVVTAENSLIISPPLTVSTPPTVLTYQLWESTPTRPLPATQTSSARPASRTPASPSSPSLSAYRSSLAGPRTDPILRNNQSNQFLFSLF